jgi:hypothetical protein
MNYDETVAEAKRLEERRQGLRTHRSAGEVQAAISGVLSQSVEIFQRKRTVGDISNNCQRTDSHTVEACAGVAQMREELAAATEEQELERRLSMLMSQARELRERGAMKTPDPQGELVSRISGGRLSPQDVDRALSMLLAMTIELVSAFGPVILSNYAEATKRGNCQQREKKVGLVADFLAERIEPAANTETVSELALYADYAGWCRASDRAALLPPEFVAGFDQIRAELGLGKIRKRKGSYAGIALLETRATG